MTRSDLAHLLVSRVGRIRRWIFFTFAPPIILAGATMYLLLTELMLRSYGFSMLSSDAGRSMVAERIAGVAGLVTLVAVAAPMLALLVKRMHDSNISGQWLWVVALPVACAILADAFGLSGTSEAPTLLGETLMRMTAVATLALIPIALWPGTAGPNRFGPDPRNGQLA